VRRIVPLALVMSVTSLGGLAARQAPTPAPPTFRLFFLGHDIGGEVDTVTTTTSGRHVDFTSHFQDRGTAVDLKASLDFDVKGAPAHFVTKGRNYRLFSSDAEVTIAGGRAHVRDLTAERDVEIGNRPFFPIDTYTPIGDQEALIQYWYAHGQPAEIAAEPAGVVRIRETGGGYTEGRPGGRAASSGPPGSGPGTGRAWKELSLDGVLWGRETAFVDPSTHVLIGLTSWAGNLPFEAMRTGDEHLHDGFVRRAVADRVGDAAAWLKANPPAHAGTFALVGATVITGTNAAPIPNATVLIRDGAIVSVGPSSSTTVPAGTATVDVHGKFITAGLWDMHAHASQTDWTLPYLAGGVTTIRDMGGEDAFLVPFRDAVAAGQALGPRMLLACLVDGSGPQAFGAVTADTPEEAVAVVRRYHDERCDQMKIYDYVKPDVVVAITAEAHRLGMTVTGHVPRGMTAESAVEAGFDHLAHMHLNGQSGSDASKAQIAFYKAHGTVMDPTMSWNELGGHAAATPIESFLPGVTRLPRTLRRQFASMSGGNGDPTAIRTRQLASLKLLKDAVDAGLLVVTGTDKGVPGFSLQRDIELFADGGMTPLEAIQAATIAPARAMKLDGEVGTVGPGKRADLVVLSADPLENIANIRSATQVVVAGRLYDAAALWTAAGFLPH
jgi:imidazolonepropionase-like amidohydrolase